MVFRSEQSGVGCKSENGRKAFNAGDTGIDDEVIARTAVVGLSACPGMCLVDMTESGALRIILETRTAEYLPDLRRVTVEKVCFEGEHEEHCTRHKAIPPIGISPAYSTQLAQRVPGSCAL